MGHLSAEGQLLLLRLGIAGLLYLFVALVAFILVVELRRAARKPQRLSWSALGHLVLIDPGPTGLEAGTRFPLAAISSIGRGLDNTVSLDDEFLSANHALLTWRDNHWWLEDLGSTNGTFVNGARIARPVPVAPGDRITLGRVTLRLE
ncbi:MAG: FHA domain-containing protein [Chloroflexia bacterium]